MKHMLFSGTEIIQNKDTKHECLAMAVRTGFLSAKGELIRSILYPTPNRFKFDHEIRIILIGMMILSLILWGTTLPTFIKYFPVGQIITESLSIFSLPIPPELPVAMSIGTIFALNKLKTKGISCINSSCINIAGQVKIVVLDKTGTITEEGLSLSKCLIYNENGFLPSVKPPNKIGVDHRVWLDQEAYVKYSDDPQLKYTECMASSHSITMYKDEPVGDMLELEMFKASQWIMMESAYQTYDDVSQWGNLLVPKEAGIISHISNEDDLAHFKLLQLHKFDFSSDLQRMSVIAKPNYDKNHVLYTKGAPEQIYTL